MYTEVAGKLNKYGYTLFCFQYVVHIYMYMFLYMFDSEFPMYVRPFIFLKDY